MHDLVRVIIASTNIELIACVRKAFANKPFIKSVITVTRPQDAATKLGTDGINILLWDLDAERSNVPWINSLRNHYAIQVVYTSFEISPPTIISRGTSDGFLTKPAIFTTLTESRYSTTLENIVAGILQKSPAAGANKVIRGATERDKIAVIASSTGGTNALDDLLRGLPPSAPPIVVVQHMPGGFTKLLADRLDSAHKLEVKEAETGDILTRGKVLIAPADMHIKLVKQRGYLSVECFVGTRIHGLMPAADILFESAADLLRSNAIGVVLTGMGSDGARGLKLMHASGSINIAQDEESCVVYGMPKAAMAIGAVHHQLPLLEIASKIMELAGV